MHNFRIRKKFLMICAIPFLLALGCERIPDENVDLLALELQRYQAIVRSDLAILDTFLDDRLIFTHASGKIDSKKSFVSSLTSGDLDYKNIDIEDAEVRMYDSCGVVTGKSVLEIRVRGEDRKLSFRFTTVWVKQQTGWRVVAYQSTHIP